VAVIAVFMVVVVAAVALEDDETAGSSGMAGNSAEVLTGDSYAHEWFLLSAVMLNYRRLLVSKLQSWPLLLLLQGLMR
jgi:hypothetical protein